MSAGRDGGHGEAFERVCVRVGVRGPVRRQVAGVAGLLLGGAGAVVAALRVGHDLRGAGGLGGGGGWWEGLRAGRVPHRLCRAARANEVPPLRSGTASFCCFCLFPLGLQLRASDGAL